MTNILKAKPVISFIIVNYFLSEKIGEAIESIQAHCESSYEVIVVDNSNDAKEFKKLSRLLQDRAKVVDARSNQGFGVGCNIGAKHATGKYIFFFNPDAKFIEPFSTHFLSAFDADPSIGAVGAKLVNADGSEGHSTNAFPNLRLPLKKLKGALWSFKDHCLGIKTTDSPKHGIGTTAIPTDSVCGAALMMLSDDFHKVGGFDPVYFMYGEEVDLQYRLQQATGKHALALPVRIYHESGGSNMLSTSRWTLIEQGLLRFMLTHRGRIKFSAYLLEVTMLKLVELIICILKLDLPGIRFHRIVLLNILKWRPSQRLLP